MRKYLARHEPPRLTDRVLAHPEGAAAPFSVLTGAVVIPTLSQGSALSALPGWLLAIMAGFLIVGGLSLAAGILGQHRHRDVTWQLERAGWWLILGGWSVVGVVVAALAGWRSVWSLAVVATTLGMGGTRLIALHYIEETVRALQADEADGGH